MEDVALARAVVTVGIDDEALAKTVVARSPGSPTIRCARTCAREYRCAAVRSSNLLGRATVRQGTLQHAKLRRTAFVNASVAEAHICPGLI